MDFPEQTIIYAGHDYVEDAVKRGAVAVVVCKTVGAGQSIY